MAPARLEPEPLRLARLVAPLLAGCRWAIGGSLLLYRLGLEVAPGDLDLVLVREDFEQARTSLLTAMRPLETPLHPVYTSACFARFTNTCGSSLDLMADIGVTHDGHRVGWAFDPACIELHDGLPWMLAEDWVTLYRLFERPAKAAQLAAYLEHRLT